MAFAFLLSSGTFLGGQDLPVLGSILAVGQHLAWSHGIRCAQPPPVLAVNSRTDVICGI